MLRKIIEKLFPRLVEEIFNEGHAHATLQVEVQRQEQRRIDWDMKMADFLNKPVIIIGNEWKSPLVGTVIGYESFGKPDQEPLPIIKDALTGETFLTFGMITIFEKARLKAIIEMGPEVSYGLLSFWNRRQLSPSFARLDEAPGALKTYDEYITELVAVGFPVETAVLQEIVE